MDEGEIDDANQSLESTVEEEIRDTINSPTTHRSTSADEDDDDDDDEIIQYAAVSGENECSHESDRNVSEKSQDTEITSTSVDIEQAVKDEVEGSVDDLDDDVTETTDRGGLDESACTGLDASMQSENDERFYPKTCRELKSLLELSKEAKLPTNLLSNRRKTLDDTAKVKEKTGKGASKGGDSPTTSLKKCKGSHFPVVTVDVEIEGLSPKKIHRKKSDSFIDGATDEGRKSAKMIRDLVMLKPNKDMFCWRCHHSGVNIACETCPRAYHQKCLKQTVSDTENWPCPECVAILKAENIQTRSKAMKEMTLEHLCSLLKYAVKRMINCSGSEPFIQPVDEKQFPEYKNYIVNPMDLTMLDKNIKNNVYGSTQAFEADARWILHNSIIFNSFSDQSRLTVTAKILLRICKQEMSEIENCSSCYLNANTKKKTWFVEVCPKPHLLVWAKLKGFPYWPAKVMSINSAGMVDVRFFGAHDRSWVNVKDCLLYSIKDPNSTKQKKNDIIKCVKELDLYVENLKNIYGTVNLAPFKTPLQATNYVGQLQQLLPNYKEPMKKDDSKEDDDDDDDDDEAVNENKIDNTENDSEALEDHKNDEESIDGTINEESVISSNLNESNKEERNEENNPPLKMKIVRKNSIKRKRSLEVALQPQKKVPRRKALINNDVEKDVQTDGQEDNSISPSKLKITHELIKKLENMDKIELVKENPSTETNDESKIITNDDMEIETFLTNEPEITITNKQESIKMNNDNVEIKPSDKTETITDKVEVSENNTETNSTIVEDNNIDEAEKRDDVEKLTADVDMCEENIRNVIHSSLNVTKKTEERKNRNHSTIKRKLPETEKNGDELVCSKKIIKLVPIQTILGKKLNSDNNSLDSDEIKNLKEVEIIRKDVKCKDRTLSNNQNEQNQSMADTIFTIKIKQESDDDTQYMEAKRQYLSALNISEKANITPKNNKTNEIRTRSKTEEKKSKTVVENPARSFLKNSDKKTTYKTNDRSEIYIKPLVRMQTLKHKARKSFPTPNYGKKSSPTVPRKILPNPNLISPQQKLLESLTSNNNLVILPSLHYTRPSIPTSNAITIVPQISLNHTTSESSQPPQNESPSRPSLVPIEVNINNNDSLHNENDLTSLKEILPENVSKGINELLCQPPPRLKPKPFGPLSGVFDGCAPSSTGPIATRINSVAQKLSDYFRGLLVETIDDIGKSSNAEATIASLRLEVEELTHKHAIELAEIRRNVSIVLKDIQKSIVEERERIINETRANCEMEMLKKVEEVKSKQWCANCSKEAQFYCCWNTSYCDYPCQQKHWLKHMNKCTQTANQNNQSSSSTSSSSSSSTSSSAATAATSASSSTPQLVLTNAQKIGAIFPKPQKVYVKRVSTTLKPTTSGGGHITLVESTPGNYKIVGNGPIAVNGKILTSSTNIIEKVKCGNLSVSSTTRPASEYSKQAQNPIVSVVSNTINGSDINNT